MNTAQLASFANLPPLFFKTLNLNVGNFSISPAYWEVVAIVFLLFLLVITLAHVRHVYVHWSFKTNWSMLFMGFLLALILEGFLIVGGKTILIELFGWKNAPKPSPKTTRVANFIKHSS